MYREKPEISSTMNLLRERSLGLWIESPFSWGHSVLIIGLTTHTAEYTILFAIYYEELRNNASAMNSNAAWDTLDDHSPFLDAETAKFLSAGWHNLAISWFIGPYSGDGRLQVHEEGSAIGYPFCNIRDCNDFPSKLLRRASTITGYSKLYNETRTQCIRNLVRMILRSRFSASGFQNSLIVCMVACRSFWGQRWHFSIFTQDLP